MNLSKFAAIVLFFLFGQPYAHGQSHTAMVHLGTGTPARVCPAFDVEVKWTSDPWPFSIAFKGIEYLFAGYFSEGVSPYSYYLYSSKKGPWLTLGGAGQSILSIVGAAGRCDYQF